MPEKISNKEYRSMEGLSSTEIKRMATSMAHFKYAKDHPDDSDTPALLFGRAYHKFCLEPYDFDNEFAVIPKVDRRTKKGKEEYIEFLMQNDGKDIIDQDMYDTLVEMRNALYSTPFAKKLIYGEHEQSFFWDDDETGLRCKCRPDSFGEIGGQPICVDLKTCQSAETTKFMRDAVKLNYDIQASHYCQGLKSNTGKDFVFVFIAQEKTPPYAVNILQADDMFMQSGYETRRELLRQYKECLERDEYPAYMGFSDDVQINTLGIPKWMQSLYEKGEE